MKFFTLNIALFLTLIYFSCSKKDTELNNEENVDITLDNETKS